jgi:coenzyme F420-reducing hydrogenase alpha subunit
MTKEITLNHITKIEGHARLELNIDEGNVTKCELSAVEGARYFEGIVVGRHFDEAHEMTSRICGICSSAHVLAAIMAVEDACGFEPSQQTKDLRVLLTLAERIRSHATHLYFLALPDYLGYESALAMAGKYKEELKHALHLMKVGNHMVKVIGGRDLHPVSATVGGWLKLPSTDEIKAVIKDLKAVKQDAIDTCNLFFGLTHPVFESKALSCSLMSPAEYPVLDGDFGSKGFSFPKEEYRKHIEEKRRDYSNANFVTVNNQRYMVSALARLNMANDQLSKTARELLERSGITIPSKNPFHNNIAQAIELVHCIEHAIDILENIKLVPEQVVQIKPRAGIGVGALEVPRGTLWHEYEIDATGKILHANIITPTAQNLYNMQEDIRMFVPKIATKSKEEIILEVEKLIRSYDPCFSCSAHFLEVDWG